MDALAEIDEPQRDMARLDAWALTVGMLVVLGGAAGGFRATSLPLAAIVLAVLPAVGPVCRPSVLPVVRYAAATIASINGTLLVFLASLAFGAAASAGTPIAESDERWMVIVALAALVSAVGTGVLVRQSQLAETHERWVQSQLLAAARRSPDAARVAAAPSRSGRMVIVAFAAVLLLRLARRPS